MKERGCERLKEISLFGCSITQNKYNGNNIVMTIIIILVIKK